MTKTVIDREALVAPAEIRALFEYDSKTGVLKWRIPDRVAGSLHGKGYLRVKIHGVSFMAHRVAWAHYYGSWPVPWPIGEVDHWDGDKANNRIKNLRDVTRKINSQNRREARSGTSGHIGVSKRRGDIKFRAFIRVDGKQKYLGRFNLEEDAATAYLQAKRKYHEGCTI